MKCTRWFKVMLVPAVLVAAGVGCHRMERRNGSESVSGIARSSGYESLFDEQIAAADEAWLEQRRRLDFERGRSASVTETSPVTAKWAALRKAASSLRPGLSEAEVEALLGAPVMRRQASLHFCALERPDIWSRYNDMEVLEVSFDSKGNVQNWHWYSYLNVVKN